MGFIEFSLCFQLKSINLKSKSTVPCTQKLLPAYVLSFVIRLDPHTDGGACYFYQIKTVHFDSCTFGRNIADRTGGAVYTNTFAVTQIRDCIFENNIAAYGGALSAFGEKTISSVLSVQNCSFQVNTATAVAGALLINKTSANISNSQFLTNVGPVGAAIYFEGTTSRLLVALSQVSNNTGRRKVGQFPVSAIYVANAFHAKVSDVEFYNNSIGGALTFGQTEAEIHNCLIHHNKGDWGATLSTYPFTGDLIIHNTTFVDNVASTGGIMSLNNRRTLIQSCYFGNNTATAMPVQITSDVAIELDLRFFNSVFIEPSQHTPLESFILINGYSETAILYFWATLYQFHSSEMLPVDLDFLHNTSMPTLVAVSKGRKGSMSALVSQFASGEDPWPNFMESLQANNEHLSNIKSMAILLLALDMLLLVYHWFFLHHTEST